MLPVRKAPLPVDVITHVSNLGLPKDDLDLFVQENREVEEGSNFSLAIPNQHVNFDKDHNLRLWILEKGFIVGYFRSRGKILYNRPQNVRVFGENPIDTEYNYFYFTYHSFRWVEPTPFARPVEPFTPLPVMTQPAIAGSYQQERPLTILQEEGFSRKMNNSSLPDGALEVYDVPLGHSSLGYFNEIDEDREFFPLQSSYLVAAIYIKSSSSCKVIFKNGQPYTYPNIPRETFDKFVNSEHHGAAYHKFIKKPYLAGAFDTKVEIAIPEEFKIFGEPKGRWYKRIALFIEEIYYNPELKVLYLLLKDKKADKPCAYRYYGVEESDVYIFTNPPRNKSQGVLYHQVIKAKYGDTEKKFSTEDDSLIER